MPTSPGYYEDQNDKNPLRSGQSKARHTESASLVLTLLSVFQVSPKFIFQRVCNWSPWPYPRWEDVILAGPSLSPTAEKWSGWGTLDPHGLAMSSRSWGGPDAPPPRTCPASPPHRFTGRSMSSSLRMDFPSMSEGMSRPAMSRMVGARSMLRTMWGFLGEPQRPGLAT